MIIGDLVDAADRIQTLPEKLRGRVHYHQIDVRDETGVQTLMDTTAGNHGQIDILVNNAAIFTSLKRTPLEELTKADWDEVLAVNVVGMFLGIKSAARHMKERRYGRIVNVASNVVFKALPMLLHYVASKGAALAMTRAAAKELGPHNITVNAVAPGYMRHEDFAGWNDRRDEQVAKLRCLDRTQTPQDVVGAVSFLVSADAEFVTGQTLVVDGGEVVH